MTMKLDSMLNLKGYDERHIFFMLDGDQNITYNELRIFILLFHPHSHFKCRFRPAHFREPQSSHHAPAQFHALTQVQVPHRQAHGFLTYLPGKMVQKICSQKCLINSIPSIRNCQDNFILLSLRRYCNGSIYPIIFNCIFNEIINHPIDQNITSCQYQFILWLFVTVHTTCDQQRLFCSICSSIR